MVQSCYYEVLGISKTASVEEIRKAYKVRALKLHPDKNHHRLEEATKEFTHLQKCYSILVDPQERCFYDIHRDKILRSGSGCEEDDKTVFDLMPFFSATAYKGFSDSSVNGFYSVYRCVFDNINGEEERLFRVANSGLHYEWTTFGNSTTPYVPTLKSFYEKWTKFSTLRSFFSIEKYPASGAQNRDHRRYLEKENKKHRDDLKREYNTTVRSLALFVKKRDPRVQVWVKDMASKKSVSVVHKQKKVETSFYDPPAWSTIDEGQYESYFAMYREDFSESEDEFDAEMEEREGGGEDFQDSRHDFVQVYFCYVCKKSFKSKSQLDNHEKSKKHKQAVLMKKGSLEEFHDGNISEEDADVTQAPQKRGTDVKNRGGDQNEGSEEDAENGVADEECFSNVSEDDLSGIERDMMEQLRVSRSSDDDDWTSSGRRSGLKKGGRKEMSAGFRGDGKSGTRVEGCNTCGSKFASRNALFQHLRELDHSAHFSQKGKK